MDLVAIMQGEILEKKIGTQDRKIWPYVYYEVAVFSKGGFILCCKRLSAISPGH